MRKAAARRTVIGNPAVSALRTKSSDSGLQHGETGLLVRCDLDDVEVVQGLAGLIRECGTGEHGLETSDDRVVDKVGKGNRDEDHPLGFGQRHLYPMYLHHLVVLDRERMHVVVVRQHAGTDVLVFALRDLLDHRRAAAT